MGGCAVTSLTSTVSPSAETTAATPVDTPVPLTLESPTVTAAVAAETPVSFEAGFADVSYTLPLTIRHVTEDEAFAFFETSRPSAGVVVTRGAGSLQPVSIINFDAQDTRHSLTVSDLKPATAYDIEVGLANGHGGYNAPAFLGQAWEPVSFRTASDQPPLRVAVIGDAGMGDQVTPQLAKQIAGYNPSFVIFVGDTVYNIPDNKDQYEAFALKYYEPLAPLLQSMPIYNVVGNHDTEKSTLYNGIPFFYHAYPPFVDPRFQPSDNQGRNQWYAFAYQNIQFIILDTQTFYDEDGGEAQLAWLKERLADTRFTYSIPAFHIPPYTSGLHTYDGSPVRQQWQPLFEANRVPLVLSGHDHNYQRLQVNGITYLVSGGGSASLYGQKTLLPESVVFAKQSNFAILDFYADRIELQAVALGGAILDQATIPVAH